MDSKSSALLDHRSITARDKFNNLTVSQLTSNLIQFLETRQKLFVFLFATKAQNEITYLH